MPVRVEGAATGAITLVGGLASVFLLPQFSPYEFLSCGQIAGGGRECFSSLNPIYPVLFLVPMAGAVLLCYSTFGRRLVLSPTYAVGVVALGLGSAALTFQFLSVQWCEQSPMLSCVATDPLVPGAAVVTGLVFLGLAGYRWWQAQ